MLIEESSPFDQALAHPFLGEPISKRLNVLSLFSMRKEGHSESFVDPSDDFDLSYRGDSHRESKQRSAKYEPPKKSKIHEITFSHDPGEIEDSSSGSFALMAQEEGRCVATEGDFAIIQERHESIADIKTSMKQIHQIQKGQCYRAHASRLSSPLTKFLSHVYLQYTDRSCHVRGIARLHYSAPRIHGN
jgi:hypothetical protein